MLHSIYTIYLYGLLPAAIVGLVLLGFVADDAISDGGDLIAGILVIIAGAAMWPYDRARSVADSGPGTLGTHGSVVDRR